MKILKIVFSILIVVILVLGVALFVFVKTFDINRFKSQMINEMSTRLGRTVELDRMDFSFSLKDGTVLNIHGFKLYETKGSPPDIFLSVDQIKLNVDVMTFLTKKEILVSSIDIKSPHINLLRNKDGEMNTQSFASSDKTKEQNSLIQEARGGKGSEGSDVSPQENVPSAQSSLPRLLIKSINVDNGQVSFKDKSQDSPMDLNLQKLNIQIDNFSLNEQFNFEISGSIWSHRKNIQLKGNAQIDPDTLQVRFDDMEINSDLASIHLTHLKQSVPALAAMDIGEDIQGTLNAFVNQMIVSPAGLLLLSIEGTLSEGQLTLPQLSVPVENIDLSYAISESDLEMTDFSMFLAGGKITGKGRLDDYLQEQKYSFEVKAEKISLKPIIPDFDPEIKFDGLLDGNINISGQGFQGDILNSLQGKGQVSVQEGKLVNLNILKLVLNKISMIPNSIEKIEENLPEKYKEQLTRKDTFFERIEMDIEIAQAAVAIKRVDLEADAFQLQGQGRVDFDQNMSLTNVALSIPEDLSASMIDGVEEFNILLNDDNQIEIPIQNYTGKVTAWRPLPDMKYLGKRIIVNTGKQEIKKLLDKVFERDEEPQPDQPSEETSNDQPAGQQKPPEQELIEDLLDKIF